MFPSCLCRVVLSSVSSFRPYMRPRCTEAASPCQDPARLSTMSRTVTAGWPTYRAACCICFQRQAAEWKRVTSQDALTMTGCRCPKLAGRESNFKEKIFPVAHPILKHAAGDVTCDSDVVWGMEKVTWTWCHFIYKYPKWCIPIMIHLSKYMESNSPLCQYIYTIDCI